MTRGCRPVGVLVVRFLIVFAAGVAIFDDRVYGGPLTTGYRSGEVTFSLSALGPNLRMMPQHLIQAMPMMVFGFVGTGMDHRAAAVRLKQVDGQAGAGARAICASAFRWLRRGSRSGGCTAPTRGRLIRPA